MVAVVENGTIQEGGVLAGGGGDALASDNTNVMLSSARMEALGLAAGMSYARNWVGKADWHIDNTGVINNFGEYIGGSPMTGARRATVVLSINGYINVMRQQVKGEWTVHRQLGHVEKRKKYRWKGLWTMAEWGNWVADGIAGRARKMAEMEEKEWVVSVDKWNAEVDRGESGWEV
jgi:hypothetical protein